MGKSIRVSPKHGLNPAMSRCFFCGGPKNDLVLFGRLKSDAKAPQNVVMDYEPCEVCKKKFEAGILLIGATETPNYEGQPPLGGGYPTGAYMLVKERLVRNLCEPETAEQVVAAGKTLIDQGILERIQAEADESEDR